MNADRQGNAAAMSTVITGASGQLARRAAEHVFEKYRPDRLILVTRRPDSVADLAARGAEARFGDFADPASLRAAFAGAKRMLFVSNTDLARRNEQHSAAVDAAAAAGVEHVVYTSIVGADPPNPAVVAPGHHFTEQALKRSGMKWTMLRNSLYADYQVPEATRALAARRFVHNRGAGRIAYVARDDCAAAAAAVLMEGGHVGTIYDVTGPHAFDAVELAALYSEVGGHKVEPVALDDETFISGIVAARSGDDHARYGAELVASFGRAIREGYLASCTDIVARLTGKPARTLREVLTAKLSPAKS
jgi:NAD(P)H dehydrogenase (quinone)